MDPTIRWLLTALVASLTVIGAGCSNPAPLTPRQSFYVADVPVPVGFELDEKRSMNKVYPNVRLVEHVYEGKGPPQSVWNFYVTQMPNYGWVQLAGNLGSGVYTLRYKKGGEYCEVTISPGGSGALIQPARVRLLIEPHKESSGSTPFTQNENSPPTRTP